jgi:hypothetical protein
MTKFGTMANELAEYYINFLKGLSRKIDANTIHIFFNKVIVFANIRDIPIFLLFFKQSDSLITHKILFEPHAGTLS